MRGAFAQAITELAEEDSRILLLTGDLGYMALEVFADRFPDRFINVGVAEQNMVGLATGLAEAGFVPFVYSIATFASLRPYEFIRNGPVLHHLPVRIVGVGGGFEYGHAGPTHHGLEDLAVMRVQPGITVIAPADHQQARNAVRASWDLPGPVYYRLGKDDKTTIPGLEGRFELGRAHLIGDGQDLLIISSGSVTMEAIGAAERLSWHGVHCSVMVLSSITPAPLEDLSDALARFPIAISVEAHYLAGGIGSLVAETIAERALDCRLIRCAVRTGPDGVSGSQDYLHKVHGLSSGSIVELALRNLPSSRRQPVTKPRISVIVPVHNQADHVREIVDQYLQALRAIPCSHELILVANGCSDDSPAICSALAARNATVRVINSENKGWGLAVRLGIAEARGDVLCYTNLARTTPKDLTLFLLYGVAHPEVVVKANRKVRESWGRRLGSLLYNLECRALFDLSYWDINGTPKVFSRRHEKLFRLKRDDDVIDAEFNVICRREGYPVLEVPIFSIRRHGGVSSTNYRTAISLYVGALQMWREARRG